jgi:hypothetical protein
MTHLWLTQPAAVPTPLELSAYLRANGWAHALNRGNFAVFKRSDEEIEVPQQDSASDYPRVVSLLLKDLGAIEQRAESTIVRDVRGSSVDTIRLSLTGTTMRDGRIPVEAGARAYEGARNLLLAAACSAIEPRSVHPKRKPNEAMNLLERARFGQPELGSFVLTIEAPVAPQLQGQLPFTTNAEEPLERATSLTLANGLHALGRALVEAAATGSIDPFRTRAAEGVSANLCDALSDLLLFSGAERLETSISFATHRPLMRPPASQAAFRSEVSSTLREAAKSLRLEEPAPDFVVLGNVLDLTSGDPGKGGTITIPTEVDGRLRRVNIKLDSSEYQKAADAHLNRQVVSLEGDLVSRGGRLELLRPRNLKTVAID